MTETMTPGVTPVQPEDHGLAFARVLMDMVLTKYPALKEELRGPRPDNPAKEAFKNKPAGISEAGWLTDLIAEYVVRGNELGDIDDFALFEDYDDALTEIWRDSPDKICGLVEANCEVRSCQFELMH